MFAKSSKCSADVLQSVANFVCNNPDFLHENFPLCSNPDEVKHALATASGWYVHPGDGSTAVFKLDISPPAAIVECVCVGGGSLAMVASRLHEELHSMKVTHMTIKVPPSEERILSTSGFTKRGVHVRFSRVPEETGMMPILPLTNVTRKELPVLTTLMFDAYAKSAYALPDTKTADGKLRSIVSGTQGEYLSSASFASGAFPNLVSACLVTKDSMGVATISELFTHPLYRARGLATTEIALAMNQLASAGVRNLVAWNREGNEVVSRLLTKMGFRVDQSVVEMAAEC